MSATARRAVITGIGLITPIGTGCDAVFAAAAAGTPGVRRIRHFDASGLPCRVGGEIPAFDAKTIVSKEARKSLKVMARTVQLGLCAAQLAMDDGGPKPGTIDPFRFGVEFGCVMVATELEDLSGAAKFTLTGVPRALDMAKWGHAGMEAVPPLWMLKYLPNMPACHTSIYFDAQGPNNTITAGEAAGVLAVGEAFRVIGRGLADYFLVGGTDSKINPLSLTRHNLFTPFTKRNDTPETAVRPFDATRDGTALGEAACVFGLETLESALARGAKIYAEICGFAAGFDRGRKGPVLARVIRDALKDAGCRPADVDHVNAHASGSVELDAFEARGIHEVFGTGVPVYAMKGQTGNTGAAAGAVELALSVIALGRGELPGTANFAAPDAACPVTVHAGPPRKIQRPYVVKIGYTDLGQCGVVVAKHYPGGG